MNYDKLENLVDEKIKEIKVYEEQGLYDIVEELALDLCYKIRESGLSLVEKHKLFVLITGALSPDKYSFLRSFNIASLEEVSGEVGSPKVERYEEEEAFDPLDDPEGQLEYARSLMEIHEWKEAVKVLEAIAATGYDYEKCYEMCGDCAFNAGDIQGALKYYETVYAVPGIPADDKSRILDKIKRCQQRRFKMMHIDSRVKGKDLRGLETASSLSLTDQVESFSYYTGQRLSSWVNEKNQSFALLPQTYKLRDLLQVGNTWAVFKAFGEKDGVYYAALRLVPRWHGCVPKKAFLEWVYVCKMMESDFLDIPEDVGVASDGSLFVIRRFYDQSLGEYLNESYEKGAKLPIEEGLAIAYQILEGMGYLHLHLGKDKQKRKLYHLDLRPSRIFFDGSGKVKLAYGGLWNLLSKNCPNTASLRNLPISFLSYRAPEQFRKYLWSDKKALICTDIYLFGIILYEILTGVNPFVGDSMEEIEILHCEQKPIPPQVVRPDIPEDINSIVMNCLNIYPAKRWRSTTQILLFVEKLLGGSSRIREFMERKKGGTNGRLQALPFDSVN